MRTGLVGGFRCVLDFWLQVNSLSEGMTICGKRDGEEDVVVDQLVQPCVRNTGEGFGLRWNRDGLIERSLITRARVAERAL